MTCMGVNKEAFLQDYKCKHNSNVKKPSIKGFFFVVESISFL